MKAIWMALPLAVALTACGGDGEGTTISIQGDNGSVTAKADKDGRLSLKAPGFEGSLKLPRFKMDAGDFDIDGVKLYPGSTITSLNIEDRGDDAGKGGVRVVFDAPAESDRVRTWFREQMEGAGFTVTGDRAELSGKTGDGSPYTLKVDPAGEGKSRGTLSVTES